MSLLQLADDCLNSIFEYAFILKPKHAAQVSLTCKTLHNFFTTSRSNQLWIRISQCKWPLINTKMNIACWYSFCKKRTIAQQKQRQARVAELQATCCNVHDSNRLQIPMVDNCECEFQCPMTFVRTMASC